MATIEEYSRGTKRLSLMQGVVAALGTPHTEGERVPSTEEGDTAMLRRGTLLCKEGTPRTEEGTQRCTLRGDTVPSTAGDTPG